jgi:hypothetical protein
MNVNFAQAIRDAAKLAQQLGPYVLLEILLPGGTLFAATLFIYRQWRQAAEAGNPAPLAFALTRLLITVRLLVEKFVLGDAATLFEETAEWDGLAPLGLTRG